MRSARRAVMALTLCLAACGADRSTDSSRSAGAGPAESASAFRVALLTPGSVSDGGWNQGAYEGLLRVRDELGAEVRNEETKTPAQFEEGFRDYGARGFALVFGHGFEYQEAAAKVAAEYPKTIFVTTSGNTVRANVAPMVFELEQATYLCGFLAARMSRTKRLGLVGGKQIPSIESTFVAFRAGAQAADPAVEVREVFTGDFQDAGNARQAALALIEEGADFLLHQANDAGRGVFQAVTEKSTESAPVYAFGTNKDQNAMAPDAILASAVLDLPGAFVAVARRVKEGSFRAEPLRLGMKDGIVSFVPSPKLAARIPEPVRAELAGLEQRIRDGALQVPRGDF
jgi:basic membrane lipoprotein Med (substrate-binding protein (PBP1-ABC) superfamily)